MQVTIIVEDRRFTQFMQAADIFEKSKVIAKMLTADGVDDLQWNTLND